MPERLQKLKNAALAWISRPKARKGPACVVTQAYEAKRLSGWIGWDAQGNSVTALIVGSSVTAREIARSTEAVKLGETRYLIAKPGALTFDALPKGWGLVEIAENGTVSVKAGRVVSPAFDWLHPCDLKMDIVRLVAQLAELQKSEGTTWLRQKAKSLTLISTSTEDRMEKLSACYPLSQRIAERFPEVFTVVDPHNAVEQGDFLWVRKTNGTIPQGEFLSITPIEGRGWEVVHECINADSGWPTLWETHSAEEEAFLSAVAHLSKLTPK
ncbi:hypothetical protein [Azonexus hydrophilus]|uniref:Uncharacterized protein n=1 Tax=Azonexus hydrophilus TaxID=418702 RepID=A0ABZ2XPN4_9RHOO